MTATGEKREFDAVGGGRQVLSDYARRKIVANRTGMALNGHCG